MTTHVLIGVGGTGAKVVESALYLMLAGVGPNRVKVALVDQDQSNGNVTRTLQLITDMEAFRGDFSQPAPDRLDWTVAHNRPGAVLGCVEVEPLLAEGYHWRPSLDDQTKFSDVIDRSALAQGSGERALLDVLFGPEEQDLDLRNGYRGKAHVGAAALLARLETTDNPMRQAIDDLCGRVAATDDVRVFVVGSVFGGTGAAGFPILSRILDEARKKKGANVKGRIELGGVLMLPYFAFEDELNEDVVKTTDLIPQSRTALQAYHRMASRDQVFDELYAAGWDQFMQMKYHQRGDNGQKNPAMPAELLGALAALEFLQAGGKGGKNANAFSIAARDDHSQLDWADLPCIDADARRRLFDRLSRLTRTAFYWNYVLEPSLQNPRSDDPWMDLVPPSVFEADTIDVRRRVKTLFARFLVWAGAMQLFAGQTSETTQFKLWNTAPLNAVADPTALKDGREPIVLRDATPGGGAWVSATYDGLIRRGDKDDEARRGTSDLFAELSDKRRRTRTGDHAGLGILLAATHVAARPL